MRFASYVWAAAPLLLILNCSEAPPPYANVSSSVNDIARVKSVRSDRISSWNPDGSNKDCMAPIDPGEERVLAEIEDAGSILHIYIGTTLPSPIFHRELVLRIYWDGATIPCVEVPFGDFFLTGFEAHVREVRSTHVIINPGTKGLGSRGYHAYFPMPFATGARLTLENQGAGPSWQFCYQIDYEIYDAPPAPELGRFHAQWRREAVTTADVPEEFKNQIQWEGRNTDGHGNYVILEAEGQGHLVGLLLNVDNPHGGWYGEGDEMIFIDSDEWPPRYHGSGTEEIFGAGATPNSEYQTPFSGFHFTENRDGKNFKGKVSMFRWMSQDPVRFNQSIRWSVEHGHANNFEIDYSSVAYWYQHEPHREFPALPPPAARIPQMSPEYFEARRTILELREQLPELSDLPSGESERLRDIRREGYRHFYQARFAEALDTFERHGRELHRLRAR